jgi:uncharacterized membrane protein
MVSMTSSADTHDRRRAQDAAGRARPHVRIRNERDVLTRMNSRQDRAADRITSFAGSLRFVYLHAVWFAGWILVNEGAFGHRAVFDPYPFGLLTMIVSLEAIFLSTFVMVSQNREAARQDLRSELDFETNIRSEIWSVHIGRVLGLDPGEIERHVRDAIAHARSEIEAGQAGVPWPTGQGDAGRRPARSPATVNPTRQAAPATASANQGVQPPGGDHCELPKNHTGPPAPTA